jgi:hypothetical protein
MDHFWKKVKKGGPKQCWLWLGARCTDRFGYSYGQIVDPNTGRRVVAHRFSYVLHGSSIPSGRVIHHECGNTLCVNPTHLRCLTVRAHNTVHNVKACKHGNPKTYCQLCEAAWRMGTDGLPHGFSPEARARMSEGMRMYWQRRKRNSLIAKPQEAL